MQKIYDTIIVGAGPAGSFAAYLLKKSGLEVLLIDRHSSIPPRKVCGEYLCPKGVALIQSYGLGDRILGSFLKLNGMDIHTALGTHVQTYFPSRQMHPRYDGLLSCTLNGGTAVRRDVFDKHFLDLAKESGVEFLGGVTFQNLRQSGDLWKIQTDKGAFLTKMTIGADGRKSMVSKCLDNDRTTTSRRVALHCFIESDEPNARRGEMHLFEDGAYIGIDPTGEFELNFSLVLDAEHLKTLGGPVPAMNHYISKSKNLSARFKPLNENAKINAAFPIQHRTKSVIPGHKLALIGDAAGFVDPLTGEGMYNALLSAETLAQEIIRHLQKNLMPSQEAFQIYSKKYQQVLHAKTMLNRVFQWVIRHPRIVEYIASYVNKKDERANTFIGIIGNIYSPFEGFIKLLSS